MRATRGREAAREAASPRGELPDRLPDLPPRPDLRRCPLGRQGGAARTAQFCPAGQQMISPRPASLPAILTPETP